ncbi:hypothetical protein LGT39_05725 [Demequina sp. TTPB684]|uniref:hypothetical protein n=1 Tax=unclassified Demequina TaxID=2620311 RepID=UPI001CF10B1B|nr:MULTISPECIES: hypothetical protein [unclassified Demequina]MCB2412346.1 hypothetical protein [Demequina sp. TTPB684]UPU88501.1 hypothetical protein LGT36_000825 [Demequina sp. TMPB413]
MTEFTPEQHGSTPYQGQPPVAPPAYQAPTPAPAFQSQPPLMPPVTTQYAPSAPGIEETGVAGSWLLATGAAIAVGAIAAFAYAAISFAIQREFLMLVIGFGVLIGLTVAFVAKRTGPVTGLLAALITAVSVLAADALMVVFFAAGSIGTGMSRLADVDLGTVISAYFDDPLGYLWLGVALFAAFSTASGKGAKNES